MDSISVIRECSNCKLPKTENDENFVFNKNRNRYEAKCRVCHNAVSRKHAANKRLNPEFRAIENSKVQRQRDNDRDAYNQWQREHYQLSSGSQEWKDRKNQRQRRNYAIRVNKHPELRDYLSAHSLEYYHIRKADPMYRMRVTARAHKRRKLIEKSADNYTPNDVIVQLKSQKCLCWWCGESLNGKYEIDHRIPISRGGHNGASNIVLTHVRCNRSKCDKMPWEWNGRLL